MTLAALNTWQTVISSIDGVRPTVTMGTAITPGATNAYGNYASVLSGAQLTHDCYLLEVFCVGTGFSATDLGLLVTLAVDPAGGTNFAGNEIVEHLLCSGTPGSWYNNGVPMAGHRFVLPVFAAAGSSIGAKAQSNAGSPPTARVIVTAYCNPTKPWLVRCGTFVRTFGVDTANTRGTNVVPGQASDGLWTQIGTAADDIFWIETGVGIRGATLNNFLHHVDVSVGTALSKRVLLLDGYVLEDANERVFKVGAFGKPCRLPNGENVYVRAHGSTGTPDTIEVACYGVGGRRVIPTSSSLTIAGIVTVDDEPAPNGKTVQIYAVDADGVAELYTTTTTAGGSGGFSVDTYEATRTYFARYANDGESGSSLDGTPESSTFDITIGGTGVAPMPVIANATTADLIRDRIVEILEGLTPSRLQTRFREFRNEGDAAFLDHCEDNPSGALRRFQVRHDGQLGIPEVSNTDFEERRGHFVLQIAYPNDGRAGSKQAISRDELISLDLDQLEQAIGLYSRANFTPPHPDAIWRDWSSSRSTLDACTYLTVEVTYAFNRALF